MILTLDDVKTALSTVRTKPMFYHNVPIIALGECMAANTYLDRVLGRLLAPCLSGRMQHW